MARIEARIDGTIKSKAKDVLANHGLPKYYSIPNRQLKN